MSRPVIPKADRAEELIHADGMISVQVLNEIANVARRKMDMSWTETRAFMTMLHGLLPFQPLTIEFTKQDWRSQSATRCRFTTR